MPTFVKFGACHLSRPHAGDEAIAYLGDDLSWYRSGWSGGAYFMYGEGGQYEPLRQIEPVPYSARWSCYGYTHTNDVTTRNTTQEDYDYQYESSETNNPDGTTSTSQTAINNVSGSVVGSSTHDLSWSYEGSSASGSCSGSCSVLVQRDFEFRCVRVSE